MAFKNFAHDDNPRSQRQRQKINRCNKENSNTREFKLHCFSEGVYVNGKR